VSNWTTVNDLLEDILRRGGELGPDQAFDVAASPYVEQAVRYLNRAIQFIKLECNWLWDRKDPPGAIRLNRHRSHSATVTEDDAAVVLSPAPPVGLGSLVGWKVDLGGRWYRIATHVAGSDSVTLDTAYDGATGTAQALLYQDEITLPTDCDKIHAIILPQDQRQLVPRDPAAFRREHPVPISGIPFEYCLIGDQKIRLDCVPNESMRLEIEYERIAEFVAVGGSTDTIPVPERHRHVLVDGALFFIFLDKDDSKADPAGILFRRGIDLLKGLQQYYKSADATGVVQYREW